MSNLFNKLLDAEVMLHPFPHVVVEGFIDDDVYADLDMQFPSGKSINKFQIKLENYIAKRLLEGSTTRELGRYKRGLNNETANNFIENYNKRIQNGESADPELPQNTAISLEFNSLGNVGGLDPFKKLRSEWENAKVDILNKFRKWIPNAKNNIFWKNLLDSSYSRGDIRVNTRVAIEGTTTLGPHIDSQQEIIAGLIYCRHDSDDSHGGDLGLYRLKNEIGHQFMSEKRRIPYEYVELEKTIAYKKNTAVFFPNSLRAIHAVTPRGLGKFERRIINVSIELLENKALWDINLGVDSSLNTNKALGLYDWIPT